MQNTEAFFDRAPLHLLTTATLGELRRLQPDSVFDRARFRPNFVVNTDETGFVENDWVDKDLDLGAINRYDFITDQKNLSKIAAY